MYEYTAKVERVVDGDTIQVMLDLGLNVFRRETIRLVGVNTPETNSSDLVERTRAKAAKAFVEEALLGHPNLDIVAAIGKLAAGGQVHEILPLLGQVMPPKPVIIQTRKPYDLDKYGRWLGIVLYGPAKTNLNEELIAKGHAVSYDGGAR